MRQKGIYYTASYYDMPCFLLLQLIFFLNQFQNGKKLAWEEMASLELSVRDVSEPATGGRFIILDLSLPI